MDFSVVICNHDYAEYVGDAISSCLAQDYPASRYEVVVVDDGSTDASRDVIARSAADPRIRVVLQPNRGQAAALLAGVERARGRFVCLLDSDDICLPGKLRALNERLETLAPLPDTVFLCHDLEIFDARSGTTIEQRWFDVAGIAGIGPVASHDRVRHDFPFAVTSGQVLSRALARRLLTALPLDDWRMGVDTVIGHGALLLADVIHYVHEPLGRYRIHGTNDGGVIRDGRYRLRGSWRPRIPVLLRDLQRLAATLDLDACARASRLAYIGRRQRTFGAQPLESAARDPLVSLVLLAGPDAGGNARTLDAFRAQDHRSTECIALAHGDAGGDAARHGPGIRRVAQAASGDAWSRLRAGWAAARGEYVAFFEPGDAPDATFVSRLLEVHRHLGLCAATVCDARVVDGRGTLLRPSLFGQARAGRSAPLAAPLADRAAPPLGTHLFRRDPAITALFAYDGPALTPGLRASGAWALVQLAVGAGGCERIADVLCSLPGDARGVPRLAGPVARAGASPPDAQMLAELALDAMLRAGVPMSRAYPPAWRRRFMAWTAAGRSPAGIARLQRIAQQSATPES